MKTATACPDYVEIRPDGEATVAGTDIAVLDLIMERIERGYTPEQLAYYHPELTLGQVYGALAYYWDHAEEFDGAIAQRLESALI